MNDPRIVDAVLVIALAGFWALSIILIGKLQDARLALAESERLVAALKASYAEYRAYSEARKDLVRRVIVPSAKPVILFRPLPLDLSIDRRVN